VLLLAVLVYIVLGRGEVVTLRSWDSVGVEHETSLWLVEDGGTLWLRAGTPRAGWLERVRTRPEVVMTRNGVESKYAASVVDQARDRVNALMAAKYGLADTLVGVVHDTDESLPVRLEPRH
jgi:hypothetical protein